MSLDIEMLNKVTVRIEPLKALHDVINLEFII